MAHKTYMELVNEALTECKVSLDPLTSVDFASPTRSMVYNLMKSYVNRAYRYLLIKRNEWFFRNERAVVTVHPRLQLRMSGAAVINIGDSLVCDSSGVNFDIVDIHTVEDVETDAAIEYTVSVEYTDGDSAVNNVILNETFSSVTPTAVANIGRIKGRGRYSLSELVPQVDEVDEESFSIQPAVDYTTNPSATTSVIVPPLTFIGPENYKDTFTLFSASAGQPVYIVRTPDGNYDFYPRPEKPYDLAFNYSQEPALMSAYDDVPELLDPKYDDLIMWMAVSYFADWDERPKVYSRAKKHMDRWNFIMDRDELPRVAVNLSKFDYRV